MTQLFPDTSSSPIHVGMMVDVYSDRTFKKIICSARVTSLKYSASFGWLAEIVNFEGVVYKDCYVDYMKRKVINSKDRIKLAA